VIGPSGDEVGPASFDANAPNAPAAAVTSSRQARNMRGRNSPGGNGLRVQRCDGIIGLQTLAAELDAVNESSAKPSPFATSGFTMAYAANSERDPLGMDVRLFVARDATGLAVGWAVFAFRIDALLGVPDAILQRSGGLRKLALGAAKVGEAPRLELMTTSDVDRPGIVARSGYEDAVAAVLLTHLIEHERDWTLLEWRAQEHDSALWRAAHGMASPLLRVRDVEIDPYSEVNLQWPNVGAYFRALSKRMRSNVSRQARKLYATGDVSLVLVDGPEATAAFFEAYGDLETRSWKYQSSAAMGRHRLRQEFYSRIVSGQAGIEPSLIGITLDGVLIAALINGRFGDRMWSMEMAFDESFNELGPGQLLLLLAVMDGLDKQCRSLNFFQLHGYFKRRWLAHELPVVNVQLIRRPSLHDVRGLGGDALRWTKNQVARRRASLQKPSNMDPNSPEADGDEQPRLPSPSEHPMKGAPGQKVHGASSGGGFNAVKRAASSTKLAERQGSTTLSETLSAAGSTADADADADADAEVRPVSEAGETGQPVAGSLASAEQLHARRMLFASAVRNAKGVNGTNAANVRSIDATGASALLPFPVR
jgi:Acetyltransferase (GNAT) domain